MYLNNQNLRIVFFIGSLRSGGKERRLIELLTYLKNKGGVEILVVLTKEEIHYPGFEKLNIPYRVIKRNWKINYPMVFYTICKEFRPQLIHTWGRMQSLYTLPTIIWQNIPLVNSQITAAPPRINKWSINNLIDRFNFYFSKVILSNSKAGIDSYNPPANKIRVIYNGVNLGRFVNLPNIDLIKEKYGICTPYTVVKAASFTPNKNFDLFFRIAEKITKVRDDISFIGVGGYDGDDSEYKRMLELSKGNNRIHFPGKINEVEALINACTIGVIFTNKTVHGEGISNSILEYMALAKPVIANDSGGTREVVHHNENGYLIEEQTEEEIIDMLLELVDNPDKCRAFGSAGKRIIDQTFSLDKMGKAFDEVYQATLA